MARPPTAGTGAPMVTLLDNRTPRHPEKAHKPDTPVLPKPDWIRVRIPAASRSFEETRSILRAHKLATVCEEAACPNIGECWQSRHATMMIMGEICTRACAFCNVTTGLPNALDPNEPENVAQAVAKLGLEHIVITSVDRDDLADGGAEHFARTIRAIRALTPSTTIEILTPDFLRKPVRWSRWWRRSPISSITTSKRCRGSTFASARALVTSPRCACCRR